MSESSIRVVVTGPAWMGSGVGSIESALEELFREAEQEIVLTVYSITTGSDLLFEWLEKTLARGVTIKMVVNHLNEQHASAVDKLKRLARQYQHFGLYDFQGNESDLHAKVVVADRKAALVGSSNLSQRGLLGNHELGVFLQGTSARAVASALDRLLASQNVKRN
jgi:phosphatidylserine/phosphatidylglycerophosphate/cardiolipin synthase-like enzyme